MENWYDNLGPLEHTNLMASHFWEDLTPRDYKSKSYEIIGKIRSDYRRWRLQSYILNSSNEDQGPLYHAFKVYANEPQKIHMTKIFKLMDEFKIIYFRDINI